MKISRTWSRVGDLKICCGCDRWYVGAKITAFVWGEKWYQCAPASVVHSFPLHLFQRQSTRLWTWSDKKAKMRRQNLPAQQAKHIWNTRLKKASSWSAKLNTGRETLKPKTGSCKVEQYNGHKGFPCVVGWVSTWCKECQAPSVEIILPFCIQEGTLQEHAISVSTRDNITSEWSE